MSYETGPSPEEVGRHGDRGESLFSRLTTWGETRVRLLASVALGFLHREAELTPAVVAEPVTEPNSHPEILADRQTRLDELLGRDGTDQTPEEVAKELGFVPVDRRVLGFGPRYDRPGPMTSVSHPPRRPPGGRARRPPRL